MTKIVQIHEMIKIALNYIINIITTENQSKTLSFITFKGIAEIISVYLPILKHFQFMCCLSSQVHFPHANKIWQIYFLHDEIK